MGFHRLDPDDEVGRDLRVRQPSGPSLKSWTGLAVAAAWAAAALLAGWWAVRRRDA
ncbi:hypothetical protein [Streptomyces sp. SID14515]|uniref:hypothetical protein n=1 Tax=Streptomyces sp. SID14515 TaxID=2706074 RepID=UPI0023B235A0|nr:hypothetical protein [Streptomyces sp. SID14515]